MKSLDNKVKSVAIIGAGPSGAITAAALKAENYFDRIRVFERRETAGGTWIHDRDPGPPAPIQPGKLPTETDPQLDIPNNLPTTVPSDHRNRWATTPIYDSLSTNVPNIAMTYSDAQLPYGPFAPHYVARQYVENYFALHQTDSLIETNTTLEDLARSSKDRHGGRGEWKLTLRKHDAARDVDLWWEEFYDAVALANGHYGVPYVPQVKGLERYMEKYPGRVSHSKRYRTPHMYAGQRVVIVGNSVSGRDLSVELVGVVDGPVVISRRSPSRWDGDGPLPGTIWKPVIDEYQEDGTLLFSDGTSLTDVDAVIYCTGYKPSFPFWNEAANGGPLFDYRANRLVGSYQHTFFGDFPTLGIVGFPKVLTFRSFEYQAVALARLWSGRSARPLPPRREQRAWEQARAERTLARRQPFHDILWGEETDEFLGELFAFAGLTTLAGDGRLPPPLTRDLVWEYEHVLKWKLPEGKHLDERDYGIGGDVATRDVDRNDKAADYGRDWVMVTKNEKQLHVRT